MHSDPMITELLANHKCTLGARCLALYCRRKYWARAPIIGWVYIGAGATNNFAVYVLA